MNRSLFQNVNRMLYTGSSLFQNVNRMLYTGSLLFQNVTGILYTGSSLFQNVNRMLYTGSSDHTGRGWVTEFGDCTRIYKGQKHTVSAIKYHEGLGTSPDSRLLRGCAMNHLQRHHLCVYVHVCSISYSELSL